ncbi:hypothetical protein GPALN_009786 [Globodera pallida]|nr:hypothetical protein GPALN_009786 [Globodera pallida]
MSLCAWVTHKLLLNFNAQEIRILSKTARLQIRLPQRVAPTHYPLSNAFPRSIVDLTSLEIAYETERSRVPNSVQNAAPQSTSTSACCTDPLSTVQRISEECVEMEQIQFKNFEKQVKEHQKDLVVGPDHQQQQHQQNNSGGAIAAPLLLLMEPIRQTSSSSPGHPKLPCRQPGSVVGDPLSNCSSASRQPEMTEKINSSTPQPQRDPKQPIVQMPRDNPMPPEEELWIGLIHDGLM